MSRPRAPRGPAHSTPSACQALRAAPNLAQGVKPGLQALSSIHHELVLNPRESCCAIALDNHFAGTEPNASCWDYLVVTKTDRRVGIEVHGGSSSDVDDIIAKKEWALEKLRLECPTTLPAEWFWLLPARASSHSSAITPKRRLLNQNGIQGPSRRVTL